MKNLHEKIISAARESFINMSMIGERKLDISYFKDCKRSVFDACLEIRRPELSQWLDDVLINKNKVEINNLKISSDFTFTHWISKKTNPDDFADEVFVQIIDIDRLKHFGIPSAPEMTDSIDPFDIYYDVLFNGLNDDLDGMVNDLGRNVDMEPILERYRAAPILQHGDISQELKEKFFDEVVELCFVFLISVSREAAKAIQELTSERTFQAR